MPHMGQGFPGHEKQDFAYILSKKPTYFFGPLIFPKRSKYKPTESEIEKFHQLYVPFQIKTPDFEVSIYKLKEDQQERNLT